MKNILFLLFSFAVAQHARAQPAGLGPALTQAAAEHKQVLLRFSGSDWCIPCIRMEKEVFHDSVFLRFAQAHLLLLNADFPRQKKHQLPPAQQAANDALAERYNAAGAFPLLVLLDAGGHVLRRWEGAVAPARLIAELDALSPKAP
ncbi:MAG: thioredoxin family protein [Chitinophagaceae bacterium]|nr:MAG: thioredoxin family protein [Chitinophagaceae bacterium]